MPKYFDVYFLKNGIFFRVAKVQSFKNELIKFWLYWVFLAARAAL